VKVLEVNVLSILQKFIVLDLWNYEYPETLIHGSLESLDLYLASIEHATHYFIEIEEKVIGWFTVFERDKELWFAMIMARSKQNQGIGSKCLDFLKSKFTVLNGWVVANNNYKRQDGTVYPSPVSFYLKYGFQIHDGEMLQTDQLSAVKITWTR
jgi:GNAT superfamily N-acetyltransferase